MKIKENMHMKYTIWTKKRTMRKCTAVLWQPYDLPLSVRWHSRFCVVSFLCLLFTTVLCFFYFRCSALGQVQYTNDANLFCTAPFLSVARIFSRHSCPPSGRLTLSLVFLLLSFLLSFFQLLLSAESHVWECVLSHIWWGALTFWTESISSCTWCTTS